MRNASENRLVERTEPRISVAKLAEFVEAGTRRRQAIVHDQKFPSAVRTNAYKDSDIILRQALLAGGDLRALLAKANESLVARTVLTQFQRTSRQCAIEVISKFAPLYESAGLDGVRAQSLDKVALTERVKGVSISARPLVRLTRVRDNRVGAFLLVSSKSFEMTAHAGNMVALLLYRALMLSPHASSPSTVDPNLCVVIDVLAGHLFTPPTRMKVLNEEIEAACLQIAGLWPLLARRRTAA